jgi:hypothetical protein
MTENQETRYALLGIVEARRLLEDAINRITQQRERDESREQIANLTQDCYYWRKKCAEARQDWHDLHALYQAEQQLCRQYNDALDNVAAQIHALANETKRKGAN